MRMLEIMHVKLLESGIKGFVCEATLPEEGSRVYYALEDVEL